MQAAHGVPDPLAASERRYATPLDEVLDVAMVHEEAWIQVLRRIITAGEIDDFLCHSAAKH
jgi:hypothetical protein